MKSSTKQWSKIDSTKKSDSLIDGNLLILKSLNKHDLTNFECVSQNENLIIHKILNLNINDYNKNFKHLNYNDDLKIFIVKEMSDLRLGGKLTLKCANQGFFFTVNSKIGVGRPKPVYVIGRKTLLIYT